MKEKKTNFAASAYQGKIYVIGVREDGRFFMNTVEIYNLKTITWSKGNRSLPEEDGLESAVSNEKFM